MSTPAQLQLFRDVLETVARRCKELVADFPHLAAAAAHYFRHVFFVDLLPRTILTLSTNNRQPPSTEFGAAAAVPNSHTAAGARSPFDRDPDDAIILTPPSEVRSSAPGPTPPMAPTPPESLTRL